MKFLIATSPHASILFLLLILGAIHSNAQDLKVSINSEESGKLSVAFAPETLDMGKLNSDQKKEFAVLFKNELKKSVDVGPIRSPCICLDVNDAPTGIESGKSIEFKLVLNGEGYSGPFSKFMHVRFTAGQSEKDVFIPIKFTIVGNEGDIAAPEQARQDEKIKIIDYNGGGIEKHPNAKAWIFAGKDCPGCNFLKRELLPKLFEKEGIEKAEAVMVDLDKKENFIYLTELEEKLNTKGEKTPVLYWKGKLIYGNEEVKKLVNSEEK